MIRPIEQVMGWTRTEEENGGRRWVTHTGEYATEADVDSMISWCLNEGFIYHGIARPDRIWVFLEGDDHSISIYGTTLLSTLAQAIREYLA